ncbi:MAG: hypothetical protein B7C54_00010 [Acidimicrobiales bacterium mtb01]|nr:hypothetical protein [Actinomycetota bacterium]TEX48657.1 MAG: hypothetical protein B7C54_00010 [Acidimicrobiales bacterium mtb01]
MTPCAVVGLGAVGSRVAHQLTSSGFDVVVHDPFVLGDVEGAPGAQRVFDVDDISGDRVAAAVLCGPTPHGAIARELIGRGVNVISTTDDPDDVHAMLSLEDDCRRLNRTVVVGAAASPGMSGLLVAELARRVDVVDEIHVAFHGTGGPACARQHHQALGGDALGWHDGEWIERPGGSGRELLWFPEPIGGKDCYRAELADPIVLQRAFSAAKRISARVSATRRDRLTARLPMMSPPHAEGGLGGLRVEIRGSKNGQRVTEVAGIAERTAVVTAAVAASVADQVIGRGANSPHGVVVLGDGRLDDEALVTAVIQRGVVVQEYVGSRN